MTTTSLIVRGDDFGLCHAGNQAILEGFEVGVLTCASLVPAGPWVAEAAALVREHPEWEIGLQLMLHCPTAGCRWGPVAGAAAVPSLAEPTGAFPPALPVGATAEDVARELAAQVERARAWGITPAYLKWEGAANAHVEAALKHLSERHGIPIHMAHWGIQSVLNRAEDPALDVSAALAALQPGVHLWVVHPAQDTPEAWAVWPDEDRQRVRAEDARAIASRQVAALIVRRGIDLISFRQHIEAQVGGEAEKE